MCGRRRLRGLRPSQPRAPTRPPSTLLHKEGSSILRAEDLRLAFRRAQRFTSPCSNRVHLAQALSRGVGLSSGGTPGRLRRTRSGRPSLELWGPLCASLGWRLATTWVRPLQVAPHAGGGRWFQAGLAQWPFANSGTCWCCTVSQQRRPSRAYGILLVRQVALRWVPGS